VTVSTSVPRPKWADEDRQVAVTRAVSGNADPDRALYTL
jgi:hypothetical protein